MQLNCAGAKPLLTIHVWRNGLSMSDAEASGRVMAGVSACADQDALCLAHDFGYVRLDEDPFERDHVIVGRCGVDRDVPQPPHVVTHGEPMPPAGPSAAHAITIEAAAALIPWVGGAASVVVGHHYRRRADEYASALASSLTDDQLEDLEDLILHDEQLQDLLLGGIEAAMRTRVDAKRRALGRILARALTDPTCIDEIELVQAALADIETAHARVLAVFIAGQDRVFRSELYGAEPDLAPVLSHLLAALTRQGIIYQSLIDGGDSMGHSDPGYSLTEFGELIVEYLRS